MRGTSLMGRSTRRLAAVSLVATLAMAGCGSDASDDEPEPSPSPETSEPTEDAPASSEVAQPGTEVQVGETATTHVQALEEGDEFYGFATVGTTVTDVAAGDPALFEQADNAADFAGLTPWYVSAEHEWLTFEGEPNANMVPPLVGFNSSGGEVSPVINSTWSAGIPGCEPDIPDAKQAGETATSCLVLAVPEGESVASVGWRGDDYADGIGSDENPYEDDPVLWLVP